MSTEDKIKRYALYNLQGKVFSEKLSNINNIPQSCVGIIEEININDNNGNGSDRLKYLNKDLSFMTLEKEGWSISPIVLIHYSWGGYTVEVSLKDPTGLERNLKQKPNNQSIFKHSADFSEEHSVVYYILEKYRFFKDWNHFDLLDKVKQLENKVEKLEKELDLLKKVDNQQ